ncbi:hypothetical protein ACFLRH_03665 [Actinomycetota bacterium]
MKRSRSNLSCSNSWASTSRPARSCRNTKRYFAKLRVQEGRGSGGNNGIASIIRSLSDEAFWRLKCGVGRPPGRMDPAAFVLKRFAKKERDDIDLLRQYGADIIEIFVKVGGAEARQQAGEIVRGQ